MQNGKCNLKMPVITSTVNVAVLDSALLNRVKHKNTPQVKSYVLDDRITLLPSRYPRMTSLSFKNKINF